MIRRVRIDQCVHYRGYRYGGFGNNLYEDYILGLASGADLGVLRRTLIDRIRRFDGSSINTALGISLSREYEPWVFPWSMRALLSGEGTYFSASENPDVVCYQAPEGVCASGINREYGWLHGAWEAISSNGYRPEQYDYIRVWDLGRRSSIDKQRRYIVLDGNHRLASLHALGESEVMVKVIPSTASLLGMPIFWPGVVRGIYSQDDAKRVHARYFLEENPAWPEIKEQRLLLDEPLLEQ